jgi:hypothetical protein
MRIHAIILALNEEDFVKPLLETVYPFCNRISFVTQYDRDWYGNPTRPDQTANIILDYPDPKGKINLVVRRLPDEAAARNMEMLSFNERAYQHVMSHGNPKVAIREFHDSPDYFWIIDADEFYDVDTIPAMLAYLTRLKPRGMRVTGYNYLRTWNRRVPRSVVDFTHFGFIRPGVLFEQRRVVNWNESRISKALRLLHLPDISSRLFGFINCPESVAVFHHGCWLGDDSRIKGKFIKSSHQESIGWDPASVDKIRFEPIPTALLPLNIRTSTWPKDFFDE